jgi:hypothetical protein
MFGRAAKLLVTVLKQEAAGPVLSLVWSHAASTVYTAGEEGRVAEWSVAKQALLTGHAGPVCCLLVAADRVWSAAQDERTVAVWRLDGEETRQVVSLAVNEPVGQLDVQVASGEDGEPGVVTAAVVTAGGGGDGGRRSAAVHPPAGGQAGPQAGEASTQPDGGGGAGGAGRQGRPGPRPGRQAPPRWAARPGEDTLPGQARRRPGRGVLGTIFSSDFGVFSE